MSQDQCSRYVLSDRKLQHRGLTHAETGVTFFDWIPDWDDPRDYKLKEFYEALTSNDTVTDPSAVIADVSSAAYWDTRKSDPPNQHDGAAREVAYAASIAYSSAEHVLVPVHVDYRLLHENTLRRMLSTPVGVFRVPRYPVPLREVLKTLVSHGLENILSRCCLTFYNLERSSEAVRTSIINGYPVVFGFVVTSELFDTPAVGDCTNFGTMVGTVVGFSDATYKIHVSDKRLFWNCIYYGKSDTSHLSKQAHQFSQFLYISEAYLKSTKCNDFYAVVGKHEPSSFELLDHVQPTESSRTSDDLAAATHGAEFVA